MFPEIAQLEFQTQTTQTANMGTSFSFDFSRGDFIIQDGRLVETTDTESLKIWINKALKTEKFRYMIYERSDENEYGVILEDLLVGREYPEAFIESELKREITAALTRNPLISSLSDWQIEKDNPLLKIFFVVNLYNGSSLSQEVNL